MKNFKADGLWWDDKNPEHKVAGTIRFTKKGLYLKLMGSFKAGWSPSAENTYRNIKGVVENNRYGSFVVLYKAFTVKTSFNSSGIGSETIFANRGVIGGDHTEEKAQNFNSLNFMFTHLESWVGNDNFAIKWGPVGSNSVAIEYTRPEALTFSVDDNTFKIYNSYSVSENISRAFIKQKTYLGIENIGEATAEEASDRFAYRLQSLLTFATDTPNELEELMLVGADASFGKTKIPKEYHILGRQVFRFKGEKKPLFDRDLLFTLEDTREAGTNIFQAWFNFVKKREEFFVVYFAHMYQPYFYIDDKFRSVMTAIGLFCASAFGMDARTRSFVHQIGSLIDSVYEEQDKWLLKQLVPDGHEWEMPLLLRRLLDENREVMGKVIDGDFSNFVSSICRTLGYVNRRTAPMMEGVLQGSDLHYAIQKLRWLLKFAIMKELGFSDALINKIADRNRNFTELKLS